MPVIAKLSGPVLSEGAGLEIPVCTLPLAEGYTASLEVFDVMQAKAKKMFVKVIGLEKVTVNAGTFDAYKVEIMPEGGEGGTKLWISRDGRRTVKSEVQLPPQMGGGSAVGELTK